MDEDFAPPEAYGARTFPEVPYLNRWWHYAAVGVGVYGGLVLLGYAFPVKSRKAPKVRFDRRHDRCSRFILPSLFFFPSLSLAVSAHSEDLCRRVSK